MAETKKRQYITLSGQGQIDLCIGDQVQLISGSPTMTIVGFDETSLKCAWFEKGDDGTYGGEPGFVLLPRASLKLVETD